MHYGDIMDTEIHPIRALICRYVKIDMVNRKLNCITKKTSLQPEKQNTRPQSTLYLCAKLKILRCHKMSITLLTGHIMASNTANDGYLVVTVTLWLCLPSAVSMYDPPRRTYFVSLPLSLNSSDTHSHAFPSMSCIPMMKT